MPKFAPPPPVNDETWQALLAAAAAFAATSPWDYVHESDLVGLIDPTSGETRIGSVLGSGGDVFAAVFYRRGGLRWVLQMLSEAEPDPESLATVEGMDVLKLELVPKKELRKDEVARVAAAGFKPAGRGARWPQFRSAEPGWHPWHITQAEAGQLLADLPRLTAFCELILNHPQLFEDHVLEEIPFLPANMPARALTPEDVEWHPMVLPPEPPAEPFRPAPEEMEQLAKLKPLAGAAFEFDSMLMPGASFLKDGRPCYGRITLLVDRPTGVVLGMELQSGRITAAEAAGPALVKGLLRAGMLPEELRIANPSLCSVLQPLCETLNIARRQAASLPALEEAMESLTQRFGGGL